MEPPLTPEQEEELSVPELDYCTEQVFPGSLDCPPEWCENEAEEGEELCRWHLPREDF